MLVIVPSAEVIVGLLHASVALAFPGAGTPGGLMPRSDPGGQNVNVGAVTSAATVNVAWQVVVNGAQELVRVKVTVVEPPQAEGAPVLLLVKPPLQPPLAVAVANQVAKAVFTAACVWQAAVVVFVGQVSTTVGAAATVKIAWQVVVNGAQELVRVNVTVVDPPQADGAPVLLLVKPPLQPPLAVAVANQVANCAFTAACVWQAAAVVFVGQVKTTGGAVGTVKVA